ncbi:polyol transporter 5-like [Macadamia integrifolia]|uniref:polyol transporter 5-like n=1 Tax=Macadamia integrifolia TaxID=60698 RepID=UPI001C4F83C1|nr:polyol transporter 5-like [Macadamia integrifolia]
MSEGGIPKSGVSAMSENPTPPLVFQGRRRRNIFSMVSAILASMVSILLGYDTGVMSGASIFIKDDLKITDTQIEILVGIINICSLLGSAVAGRISDWIGRRYTIVFASVIFFVGAILMGLAPNFAWLMVGRIVAGVGVGFALMIAPVYTAEISPAMSRGFLTSFPEVFINTGVLLGYISNISFSQLPEHLSWRLMLGAGGIPSAMLAFGILIMPESPRWLVMQGRLGEARKVLNKTCDSNEEAELRLADIKSAVGIPENCVDDVVSVPKRSHGEGVWKELLIRPTPSVRRVLIAAVGIHLFQQASGIDAVVLYSPRIFEKAGIKKKSYRLGATVAVGFSKTIFILVATFLLDRIGRRPLLLGSTGGMIVCLIGLASGLTVVDHSEKKLMWAIVLCVVMTLTFVASFSIGLGPIPWVYSSEIFPLRLRAQGVSIGVAVNRVMSGVIGMTFLSLYKAITIERTFFMFAGITGLAWTFFYTFLPETQGKTLEEMEGLFSTSRFKWKSSMKKDNDDVVENQNGRV